MSQEGIIVCAWPVLCIMFCAAPFWPSSSQMHMFTHFCYWAPEISFNHSLLLVLAEPGLVQRDTDPDPRHYNIGCQCGVSLNHMYVLFFYLYGQSCFHHLFRIFLSVQNSAQLFPPRLIWNSNRHNISLRSMKYVAILSRLSSDFEEKKDKTTKKKDKNKNI